MLERIHRAIDAGAFAIPDTEDAIDLCTRKQSDLLAAPDRGCREIFIQSRREFDIMRLQKRFGSPKRVVIHPEWRTAIARYEAGGIEIARTIVFALQHRKPDQRLGTRQEDSLRVHLIFVIETGRHQRHEYSFPRVSDISTSFPLPKRGSDRSL